MFSDTISELRNELKATHEKYQHYYSLYKGEILIFKKIKEKQEKENEKLLEEMRQLKTILKVGKLASFVVSKTIL